MSVFLQALALATVALASQTVPSSDPCLQLIPKELAKAVTARFPSYRLPTVQDSLEKQHGGDGCLGADRDYFNGDGEQDLALLLPDRDAPEHEGRVILVAGDQFGMALSDSLYVNAGVQMQFWEDHASHSGRLPASHPHVQWRTVADDCRRATAALVHTRRDDGRDLGLAA